MAVDNRMWYCAIMECEFQCNEYNYMGNEYTYKMANEYT